MTDERTERALTTVRTVWGGGTPEGRGSLRMEPERWPDLADALDVLAGISYRQGTDDLAAFWRWEVEQAPRHTLPTTREELAEFFGDLRLPNGAVATGIFVQAALDAIAANCPDTAGSVPQGGGDRDG